MRKLDFMKNFLFLLNLLLSICVSAQSNAINKNNKPPTKDTIIVEKDTLLKQLEEVTILTSTRNNQRIENSPLKIGRAHV